MTRPPSDDPRIHHVTLRLNGAELAALKAAIPKGMTLSDWIRSCSIPSHG